MPRGARSGHIRSSFARTLSGCVPLSRGYLISRRSQSRLLVRFHLRKQYIRLHRQIKTVRPGRGQKLHPNPSAPILISIPVSTDFSIARVRIQALAEKQIIQRRLADFPYFVVGAVWAEGEEDAR